MPEHIPRKSASDLLAALANEALVQSHDADIESIIRAQHQNNELPLYIKALTGVGALIASFCFIGFVAIGISATPEKGFIVWGLILAALAIGFQKLGGDDNSIKKSFQVQFSFACMVAGKALFSFGLAEIFDSGWGATIGILVSTAATYHIYPVSAERFLSTFAVFFSILANILISSESIGSRELFFNGCMLLYIAGVAILIVNTNITRDYIPLMYGLIFSLCTGILFLASQGTFGYLRRVEFVDPTFMTMLLTASLIASIIWLSGGKIEKLKTEPIILAFLGIAILGLISAPGIILSIILMILGYAGHQKIKIAIGAVLVPVFLFLFYYSLDVSLMEKSGVLVGSGVALLIGYFYIGFKGWSK